MFVYLSVELTITQTVHNILVLRPGQQSLFRFGQSCVIWTYLTIRPNISEDILARFHQWE